jgi:hypothetical protein
MSDDGDDRSLLVISVSGQVMTRNLDRLYVSSFTRGQKLFLCIHTQGKIHITYSYVKRREPRKILRGGKDQLIYFIFQRNSRKSFG